MRRIKSVPKRDQSMFLRGGLRWVLILLSGLTDTVTAEDLSCGPRAVRIAARVLDRDLSPESVHTAFQGRVVGQHSLAELADGLVELGLSARVEYLSPKLDVPCPVIVCLRAGVLGHDQAHFVVLYGFRDGQVQVIDFPRANHWLPMKTVVESAAPLAVFVSGRQEAATMKMNLAASVGTLIAAGMLVAFVLPIAIRSISRQQTGVLR